MELVDTQDLESEILSKKYIHNITILRKKLTSNEKYSPLNQNYPIDLINDARVVELVDTQDLGSCDASRGGSNPSARTSRTRAPPRDRPESTQK